MKTNKKKSIEKKQEIFERGIRAHQQSQLDQAKKHYLKFLSYNPQHSEAHHLLGIVYHQLNDYALSVKYQLKATEFSPSEPKYFKTLADIQIAHHDYTGAIKWLMPYIDRQPDRQQPLIIDLLRLLTHCFIQVKEFVSAINYLNIILKRNPLDWQAHLSLGNCYFECVDYPAAQASYQRVLEILPHQVDALNNLGSLALKQAQLDLAQSYFYQATQQSPQHFVAWANLASVLCAKRFFDEAIICCKQSLSINTHYLDAHLIYALSLSKQSHYQLATDYYLQLVKNYPDKPQIFSALGNHYQRNNQTQRALLSFENALVISPNYSDASYNLALINIQLKQHVLAISQLENLLTQNSSYHQARPILMHLYRQACFWDKADEQKNICRKLLAESAAVDLPPFSFITLEDSTNGEQILIAQHWMKLHAQGYLMRPMTPSNNLPINPPQRRLRIGYLSADLHEHATSYLMIRVLELHDKQQFEIFAYSYGPNDGSPMRARIERCVDHFCDLQMVNIESMAQQIKNDQLDLLIDLKGFTQNTRSQLLALRPAPIQINFLGYPATMGRELVDYVITDHYLTPSDNNSNEAIPQFLETPIFMPNCYQPNDPSRCIDAVPTRQSQGLPEDGFIFGAFHQVYKINHAMLRCWSNILLATSNSVLWLLTSDSKVESLILQRLNELGIASQRIVFAPRVSAAAHLARLTLVDLMLDTFPVNGHTSTSDALWAEVPVLTLSGETFISRVAGSILQGLAMSELISTSLQDYEQRAVGIAQNPHQLLKLKNKIHENKITTPLFNCEQYTRDLENLLSDTWRRHWKN